MITDVQEVDQKIIQDHPNHFRMVDIVLPDSTNHYGTLFAGNVVALLVRGAFLAATQFCKQSVVLAGADQINCILPIKQGSIVELNAHIVHSGNSSLTVQVELYSKGSTFDKNERAAEGYFNLVAVDATGKPLSIKKHVPENEIQKTEWMKVEKIKEFRKQLALNQRGQI